jgi:hypothetical protein
MAVRATSETDPYSKHDDELDEYIQAELGNLRKLEYWAGVSQRVHFPSGKCEGINECIENIPNNRHKRQRVDRLLRNQNNCDGVSFLKNDIPTKMCPFFFHALVP